MWFGGINIILLGLVSLLNDFSSEMILPILPMFISSLGGTGLTIGLIGGLIDGFPQILKVFAGYLSDKIKSRKKFIFFGYFISQFFKLMLFFSQTWLGIMIFTSLDKLGKGIREAPRDALISESSKDRGRAFGIQRTFDTSGAILGSLVVLILFLVLGESIKIRSVILFASIIGFFCLIPIFFVRDSRLRRTKHEKINFVMGFKSMSMKLKGFLLVSAIFALGNFSYMFFILKSKETFGFLGSGFIIPIALYVLFNIFYASFAIPFGSLSDKIGRRKVIVAGFLLFTLLCLGFVFFHSLAAYIILFILYGLSNAMIVGNQRAFVANNSPDKFRATSLGIFQTTIGVCAIFSGLIAGLLFDVSSKLVFMYGALLSLISVILFISLYRKDI